MEKLSDRLEAIIRVEAITGIAAADQLEHPEAAFGELNEDYTQAQHHNAFGSDVFEYYEQFESEDIKLKP